MKIFTIKLLGLVISALLFGACSQMATYENDDLTNTLAKSDQSGFTLSPFEISRFENAMVSESGNFNLTYTEKVCLGDAILFTFGGTGFTGNRTVQVQEFVNGEWVQVFQQSQASSGVSGNLSGYEVGTYLFRWKVSGQGGVQNVEFTVEVEDCSNCDEESFTYEATIGETEVDVVFSYSYSEEAEVSIDFTFPQINIDIPNQGSYVGADGKSYTVTGNGTVFHWTGPVSCSSGEPTTFAFEGLMPDCGPSSAKDGLANIWTNAKIVAINGEDLVDDPETLDIDEGPYSLKGDLESIVYSGCPTKD
ncbi:hypothetical protein JYB62_12450 [Algoriphagus lutimaris]|uniref:hypothetical protein n=1 Tax=Algoriphagus lutimaris TaxID=613197 RepID=UPI00196A8AF9|nr:hypothetical protein [Algoriphagus lutimaris]MBN3520810.1 hypothetical protein [Algoriphagus lutimaris]